MMDIMDLRLIADGCDSDFINTFNECACMNEAFGSAYIKSVKAKHSKELKDAKSLMQEAKKLKKNDPKEALKKYNDAIKIIENFKDEVNNIEDDDLVSALVVTTVRTLAPSIAIFLIPANVVGAIADIVLFIMMFVSGYKGISDVYKACDDPTYAKKVAMDYKSGKIKKLPWDSEKDGLKGISRAEAMVYCNKLLDVCYAGRDKLEKFINSVKD